MLYQIEFHATIAEQEGRFSRPTWPRASTTSSCAATRTCSPTRGQRRRTGIADWEAIKAEEKGAHVVFEGAPRSLPALNHAQRVSARRARSGSIGRTSTGTLAKVAEEVAELASVAGGDDERDPSTNSATRCSPPSTWPDTRPRPRDAAARTRRPSSGLRFEAVEALGDDGRTGLTLDALDLAALDALLGRGGSVPSEAAHARSGARLASISRAVRAQDGVGGGARAQVPHVARTAGRGAPVGRSRRHGTRAATPTGGRRQRC